MDSLKKDKVFPKKALYKFLEKDFKEEIGKDAEVEDKDILLACKKHLQEKGFLPTEWEEYVLSRIGHK